MVEATPAAAIRPGVGRMALFTLLGFSAGLPFYLFSTVLFLRLTRNGVDLMTISFFAWVALLPTFKFLWAPLLDRYTVLGFGRFWGKRRGWILLSQLGIASLMVALAFANPDRNLALTALWAVALAFWTTTLEVAADAWRIELAPEKSQQAPLVAATLWGYRSAMVAAGSITLIIADGAGWTTAYLVIALGAFLAFPILIATSADLSLPSSNRWTALGAGLLTSAVVLTAMAAIFAGVGSVMLMAAARVGLTSETNITPIVLALSMLPFIAMALAIPRIRRAPRTSRLRSSPALGPYVDFFLALRIRGARNPCFRLALSHGRRACAHAVEAAGQLGRILADADRRRRWRRGARVEPGGRGSRKLGCGALVAELGACGRRRSGGYWQPRLRLARQPTARTVNTLCGDGGGPVRQWFRRRRVRRLFIAVGEPSIPGHAICVPFGVRISASPVARRRIGIDRARHWL